jgi:hypothetical protein
MAIQAAGVWETAAFCRQDRRMPVLSQFLGDPRREHSPLAVSPCLIQARSASKGKRVA